jgi:AcrR family transcriptional regulator
MATRDPDAKRRQLLDAALTEFAAHGIAGARVDRIATLAECSAGLVYTYFGSKDDLFDAVFDAVVVHSLAEAPITPDDLPGYAGTLFDAQEQHPEVMRLATWYQLERAGSGRAVAAIAAAGQEKADALRAAQQAGSLTTRFSAEQLLLLVLTLASMWSTQSPESAGASELDRSQRRSTVVDAVRRLVES